MELRCSWRRQSRGNLMTAGFVKGPSVSRCDALERFMTLIKVALAKGNCSCLFHLGVHRNDSTPQKRHQPLGPQRCPGPFLFPSVLTLLTSAAELRSTSVPHAMDGGFLCIRSKPLGSKTAPVEVSLRSDYSAQLREVSQKRRLRPWRAPRWGP